MIGGGSRPPPTLCAKASRLKPERSRAAPRGPKLGRKRERMSVEVAERLRCHCAKCIDFHTHFLQREVFNESHPHSVSSCFGQNMLSPELPSFQRMFQPELQIEDMDARGIDINVLTSCDVVQSRA